MARSRVKIDTKFKKAKAEIKAELYALLEETADKVVTDAKKRAPVDTGTLKDSIGRTP